MMHADGKRSWWFKTVVNDDGWEATCRIFFSVSYITAEG